MEAGARATRKPVRVVIADDNEAIRDLVARILERTTEIEIVGQAHNGEEAYRITAQTRPDVVLMDIRMPIVDGIEATRRIKAEFPRVEVVGMTGTDRRESSLGLILAGASGFILKGAPNEELVRAVLAAARGQSVLAEPVARTVLEEVANLYRREKAHSDRLEAQLRSLAGTLAATIEARDVETGEHSTRVTALALDVLRVISPETAERPIVEFGYLLHDIGKIAVADAILRKPGPLTSDEWTQMRRHPVAGAELLRHMPELEEALPIVRHHHEHWDGGGYPDGLVGLDIAPACRAFAVSDAFDAMTSDRHYRPAMSFDEAVEEIWSNRGRQFDPDAAEVLIEIVTRIRSAGPRERGRWSRPPDR